MVKDIDFRGIGIFLFILLAMLIILTSCSKDEKQSYKDESDINAAAAAKIYRACKYDNENFCDNPCCKAEKKCGSNFAYKECDLKVGEWKESLYADSNCITICEEREVIDEPIEINETYNQIANASCKEGWQCKNDSIAGYLLPDCSWTSAKFCSNGCFNGTCIPLCVPGTLICDKNNSRICDDDGNRWSFHMKCENGCKDGLCVEINSTVFNNTNLSQNNQTLNNLTNLTQPNNSTLNITQPNNTTQDNSSQNNSTVEKTCNSCIKLNNLHYDAEDNDCQNPNDEYAIFDGNCTYSCDLASWTVSDASSHVYTFPTFTLIGGNTFTLYTGNGTNTATELYWGSTYAPCKAVWNNNGDNLTLKNQNNEVILFYSYS